MIQTAYLVNSGVFAVFPTAVVNTFGSKYGPRAYSLVMLSNVLGALINLGFINVFYEYL